MTKLTCLAPNRPNACNRADEVRVDFVLWNYCKPDDRTFDNEVHNDPWKEHNSWSQIVKRLVFDVFPFLQFYEFAQRGNIPVGHSSARGALVPVRSTQELFKVLGTGRRHPFALSKSLQELTSACDDTSWEQWIHAYEVKGKSVLSPQVLRYESGSSWKLCEYGSGAEDTTLPAATIIGDAPFRMRRNRGFFLIPLPFALTKAAADYLRFLLQNTLDGVAVHRDAFWPCFVEATEDGFQRVGAKKTLWKKGSDTEAEWTVPLFSVFHLAQRLTSLYQDRLEWVGVTDLGRTADGLSPKELEVRYRGLLSSLLRSVAEREGDVKGRLEMSLLGSYCRIYVDSFRQSAIGLITCIEYLMDSTLFMQLEDTTFCPEEMDANGWHWVRLFKELAPVLQSHPKGCWVYSVRSENQPNGTRPWVASPMGKWMAGMFDGILKQPDKQSGFWKNAWDAAPHAKRAGGIYASLLNLYVFTKVRRLPSDKEDVRAWSKALDKAADNYKKNLPARITGAATFMDYFGTTIDTADLMKKIYDGDVGFEDAGGAADLLGKAFSSAKKETYPKLFSSGVMLQGAASAVTAVSSGEKAYQLFGRGDYNAAFGGALVTASAGTTAVWTFAAAAAPAGPIGWLLAAAAVTGGVIMMVCTDNDFETFAEHCHPFAKKLGGGDPLKYWEASGGSYSAWQSEEIDAYRQQLNSLLATIYKIEKFKTEVQLRHNLWVFVETTADPRGCVYQIDLEFKKGRFDGVLRLTLADLKKPGRDSNARLQRVTDKSTHVDRFQPGFGNRFESGVFTPTMSSVGFRFFVDDGKWAFQILCRVKEWRGCKLEDARIKVYPFRSPEFPCPPADVWRRPDSWVPFAKEYSKR
ncbi:MAG: hypothetical protein AAF628_03780 [Planctomycetota bacterium]